MEGKNETSFTVKVEKNVIGEYAAELEKNLLDEIKNVTDKFVLDLSNATVIDSRGIALCIGLLKECEKKKISLLFELSPELSKFFKIFKLNKILPVKEKESGDDNTR